MNLVPNAGENSPHTGIIRINWEIFPLNPNGTYGSTMSVDMGVLLLKTDALTMQDCKQNVEELLKKHTEDKNFVHIWKRGVPL